VRQATAVSGEWIAIAAIHTHQGVADTKAISARRIGNRRQSLKMITYALGVNALSMHVRRQGLAPPQAGRLSP
jgi:hypothetical protein